MKRTALALRQRIVVRLFIRRDLLGNGVGARKRIAEPDAKHQIRDRARGAAIAVNERMNPIQPLHDIRGEVKCRTLSNDR